MKSLKIEKRITERNSDSIQKYLQELNANSNPISREEEKELVIRAKNGDIFAKEKIIKSNLRFVVSVAKQYQGQSTLGLEDLIGEGNIGMIRALEKFDETQNVKFISYAVWWIRQSIISAITEKSNFVRVPSNKVSQYKKIRDTKDLLSAKQGREPSTEEIIDYINENSKKKFEITEEDVYNAFANNATPKSLDAEISSSDETSLIDLIPNQNSKSADHLFDNHHSEYLIGLAIECLSERDRLVISMLFGLNGGNSMSLEDVSEEVGLTKERVRQIKDTCLRLMRNNLFKKFKKIRYDYV